MTFEEILDQAIAMLQRRGRLTYRTLQLQFHLDDEHLEALKDELIYGQRLAVDEDDRVLVWMGDTGTVPSAAVRAETPAQTPLAYTPPYLAEKILTSRSALEGERKQVTVLFADLEGSMALLADGDDSLTVRSVVGTCADQLSGAVLPDGRRLLDNAPRLIPDLAGTILAAHGDLVDGIVVDLLQAAQDLQLLVAHRVGVHSRGRLHRHQAEELHHVVLHHVAEGPGMVIIGATPLDPEALRNRDLHVIDMGGVP